MAADSPFPLAPVAPSERLSSLDVLRGAALLGIALVNIIFSGLPLAAGYNPNVAGGATGPNLLAFFLQYVLFDGKMRGTFSIMFGAGSYYMIQRGLTQGNAVQAIATHYRRTLWLMLFGVVHAFLIWHGDILYPYALLGLLLFPLHSAKPRQLLLAAGVFVLIMTGFDIARGFDLQKTHRLYLEARQAEAARKPLTEEQTKARKAWEELRKDFQPTPEDLKNEAARYNGSYANLVEKRAAVVKDWHSRPFYFLDLDILPMMLIGTAFAQLGLLAAAHPRAFYWKMLAWGYGFGLPVGAISFWLAWRQSFDPLSTVFTFCTYQPARVATTLGHIALVLLLCQSGALAGLQHRLAAVGRMAFSNYILHSLAYGFVFYGYGLNLYNRLERYQLYFVVLALWIISLILSPLWLARYQFGPLEWAWRSLTYWQRQPLRLAPAETSGE